MQNINRSSLTDEFQVLNLFLLLLDLEGCTGGGRLVEILCRCEASQASTIHGSHDHRGTPRHDSLDVRRPVFLECLQILVSVLPHDPIQRSYGP